MASVGKKEKKNSGTVTKGKGVMRENKGVQLSMD